MGGTFDPIHIAHLVTAEAALEQFGLDKVIFVPAGLPPHKLDHVITPAEHRYNMVALATASNKRFEVSRIEIERPGPSYSVDTVEEMRRRQPENTKLYFITGVDAILDIETWHRPERLFQLCHFIAAQRPGYSQQAAPEIMWRLGQRYGCQILLVDAPAIAISSSDLRRRASDGRSIKYLVPEAVEDYIQKHGLYRPQA